MALIASLPRIHGHNQEPNWLAALAVVAIALILVGLLSGRDDEDDVS